MAQKILRAGAGAIGARLEHHRQVAHLGHRQLHHEGHALKDMHVLYRAHYQSLELQMELNAMGVPFVITSGHKFFDLAHVKDILAHLRFVHNPLDQVALSRLLCLLPKVGPVAAEKISKAARETDEAQGRGLVRALRADAVLKRVPESAKDDFNDLTITLEDMLEGLEAAKAKPGPVAPAPDLFVAASDANSVKVARTPAETVRVCIEGWYGGFIKTIFPDWKERGAPLLQPVTGDQVLFLSERDARETPHALLPACFDNHGNYVISLGAVSKWLGEQAEALGVEIMTRFSPDGL